MMRIKLITVAFAMLSCALFADGKLEKTGKDFKYESDYFTCTVQLNGSIKNLRLGDKTLADSISLHGNYKVLTGAQHDSRFFPKNEKKHVFTQTKQEDNVIVLEKNGTLSNKQFKPGATYVEIIKLSPEKIDISFTVVSKAEFASNSSIFTTLIYMPVKTFGGGGFKTVKLNSETKLGVFPKKYLKASRLNIAQLAMMVTSLENGLFKIECGKNSAGFLQDTRSWNASGKTFRLDVSPVTQWTEKPKVYPAGTVFKWSLSLSVKKHEL